MKRRFAALLLIAMPCQALSLNASAGHVLTGEELARAYALTGLGREEGVYHNGMKPNASWNAAQLSDYLEEKLSKDIYNLGDTISRAKYALAELKESDPAAYKRYTSGNVNENLDALTAEAEVLREEMRYYQTWLTESAGLIAEMKAALEDDDYGLFDSDKVRYSARIEEAAANLTADRQTVVDNIDAWEARADRLQEYLSYGPFGGDEGEPFVGDALSALFAADEPMSNSAKATAVTASSSRLSRLAAGAGLLSNDGVDVEIDVLTDRQVGISFAIEQNGKRTPVVGVPYTVRDFLNPKGFATSDKSNGKGNAVIPTNKLTTDEYDSVHLTLTVDGESLGYRSIMIDDLDLDLGEPYEITMIPLWGRCGCHILYFPAGVGARRHRTAHRRGRRHVRQGAGPGHGLLHRHPPGGGPQAPHRLQPALYGIPAQDERGPLRRDHPIHRQRGAGGHRQGLGHQGLPGGLRARGRGAEHIDRAVDPGQVAQQHRDHLGGDPDHRRDDLLCGRQLYLGLPKGPAIPLPRTCWIIT